MEIVVSDRTLYTPSIFAKDSLLHLQESGYLKAMAPHVSKRSSLQSYLFFVVLSGEGSVNYDGKKFLLKSGDCAFINCSDYYEHSTSNPLWELQWIHFYGPTMDSIYEKYLERGGEYCFTPQSVEGMMQILKDIHSIASSTDYIRDMKICEKITSLLAILMEESWKDDRKVDINNYAPRNMQEVKQYIEQHYTDTISLDQLAHVFYINKYYMCRLFKKQYGISIQSYQQQLRITEAKRLLRFSDIRIEEVAQHCGIQDYNYFIRLFKSIVGSTPRNFRVTWRGQN